MGLFTKVPCAICGKETRFSKTKLADGNYICGNCLGDTYYAHDLFLGIRATTKLDFKKMTLEDVKACYEIRKQNLEELKNFKCFRVCIINFINRPVISHINIHKVLVFCIIATIFCAYHFESIRV